MKNLIRLSGILSSVFIFIFIFFNSPTVFSAGGVNLIANPSVETASPNSSSLPASWFKGGYGTNTRVLTYPDVGGDGTKAIKVEITNYTSGDAKWYFQPVSVTGGQQLLFSDSYKSTTGSYVTIQYKLQDGTFRYLDIAILPASSSWAQFTKTFTVPTNYPSPVVSMTVFHLIKSVGYIITDNYNLQDTTVVTPPPASGTIKVNVIVINNDDGTKNPDDFTLAVDTEGVTRGVDTVFPVGPHVVSQTSDPNYTSIISGDCDADGNISIADGDHKVCTITNDDVTPVPSIPTNFITNPSVETVSPNSSSLPLAWSKGGYGVNTRVLTYGSDSQDGLKGLKTEITSYTSGDAKWYFQQIPVSGGQQYTYTEYYKSNISSEIDIQYQLQDGTFKYSVFDSNLPAVSDWDQVSYRFTVPTYTSPVVKMTVFHVIKSVGWLSTDNYSLSTYTPPPTDPNNTILNPSVETPSGSSSSLPAFWSRTSSSGITSTFTYPVSGYNSTRAMQINVTNYTGGSGAKWYFQSVPVSGGEEYYFSDYFKSTAPSYLSIQFQMDDGTYKYLDLTLLAISTDWKQASDTFTVPANAVYLTILHVIKDVGMLTTDNYILKKLPSGAFSLGMVSLNFDDGLDSVYENAIPILNNAGIKSSQYVVSQFLGDPGFWTVSQLNTVASTSLHEIGAHTRTHPYLTQLSSTQLFDEIIGSKNDLINLGYNPTTFAYPFGDYNDAVVQVLKDAGFKGARSVHIGFNTKNSNPFALSVQHVESDTTIDLIKSWIDQAILNKTWLILEIHNIDHSGVKYSTTPEVLQQIVDYIKQTNVKVVDNNEGLSFIIN